MILMRYYLLFKNHIIRVWKKIKIVIARDNCKHRRVHNFPIKYVFKCRVQLAPRESIS